MGTKLGTALRRRMETAVKALAIVAIIAFMFISSGITPALAHHSFAMYDQTKTKTLTGKLTRFVLGANHAQLLFELVGSDGKPELDANGKPVVWGVETASAKQLATVGVTAESFPFGTIITVSLMPLRDGRNFGAMTITGGTLIACGMTFPEGGCNEKTGKVYMKGNR
jgi:hypothetical protein